MEYNNVQIRKIDKLVDLKKEIANSIFALKDKKVEEVHHMLPLSRGGTNDEDNLISLYKSCHSKIHTKSRDRFGG